MDKITLPRQALKPNLKLTPILKLDKLPDFGTNSNIPASPTAVRKRLHSLRPSRDADIDDSDEKDHVAGGVSGAAGGSIAGCINTNQHSATLPTGMDLAPIATNSAIQPRFAEIQTPQKTVGMGLPTKSSIVMAGGAVPSTTNTIAPSNPAAHDSLKRGILALSDIMDPKHTTGSQINSSPIFSAGGGANSTMGNPATAFARIRHESGVNINSIVAAKRAGMTSSQTSIAYTTRHSEASRAPLVSTMLHATAGNAYSNQNATSGDIGIASVMTTLPHTASFNSSNHTSNTTPPVMAFMPPHSLIENDRTEGNRQVVLNSTGSSELSSNAISEHSPIVHGERHAVLGDERSHVEWQIPAFEYRHTAAATVPSTVAPPHSTGSKPFPTVLNQLSSIACDIRHRSKPSNKISTQKVNPNGHRNIGFDVDTGDHDILLPRFDEYPVLQGLLPENQDQDNPNEPRTHKYFTKPVVKNPEVFDQMYPIVIPTINNEPVVLQLMRIYYPRWPRKSFRYQLPILTPDNIKMFLFHLARIGDHEALRILCKSPMVDIESSDDTGRTALIFAAIGGHVHCIRLLCAHRAFINRQDRSGRTALHWAAYHGFVGAAKELCENRADILQEDYQGKSAIHCATYPETIDTLEYLIRIANPNMRHGAIMAINPNQRRKTLAGTVHPDDRTGPGNVTDLEQMTPLMWAAYHGHDRHIEVLLSVGHASAFMQDIEGKTALHWATSNRHGRCCEILLSKYPALINIPDKMGRVPLHYGCGEGNIAVVEMIMLSPGSNWNALDGLKRTPLHWAAVRGQPACINLLCQKGASINNVDDFGASALCYAIQHHNMDCVHVLLRKGAAVDSVDIQGRTPLMWASLQGNLEVIKMLIKANAKVTVKSKSGMTALHHAAYGGHTTCCTHLLRGGALIDAKDKHGQTALIKATMMGSENAVILLANEGAYPDEIDNQKRTALHWAAAGGSTNILQLLTSHGATINIQDANGRTPLAEASLAGHIDTVMWLLDQDANDALRDRNGVLPIHLAASKARVEVCKILHTPDTLNARDGCDIFKSKTPLDYVMETRSKDCIAALRDCNALTAKEIATKAAKKLQLTWRCYKGKKNQPRIIKKRPKHVESLIKFTNSSEAAAAATYIQSWYRCQRQKRIYIRTITMHRLMESRRADERLAEMNRQTAKETLLEAQKERERAELEFKSAQMEYLKRVEEIDWQKKELLKQWEEIQRLREIQNKQLQELQSQKYTDPLQPCGQPDESILIETGSKASLEQSSGGASDSEIKAAVDIQRAWRNHLSRVATRQRLSSTLISTANPVSACSPLEDCSDELQAKSILNELSTSCNSTADTVKFNAELHTSSKATLHDKNELMLTGIESLASQPIIVAATPKSDTMEFSHAANTQSNSRLTSTIQMYSPSPPSKIIPTTTKGQGRRQHKAIFTSALLDNLTETTTLVNTKSQESLLSILKTSSQCEQQPSQNANKAYLPPQLLLAISPRSTVKSRVAISKSVVLEKTSATPRSIQNKSANAVNNDGYNHASDVLPDTESLFNVTL
ncbi:hypothetical protein QVD99_002422 [Batrachochytrium dendrobatidis]|nr:hypothetical protein O5D80_006650 [Batrachochytrium dendrobatidis]KAK5670643.1 hypothetical protein QVD99_002422 [Batrachochytrium dendrobatidis]